MRKDEVKFQNAINRKDKWTRKVHNLTLPFDSGTCYIIFFTLYFSFGQVDHRVSAIGIWFEIQFVHLSTTSGSFLNWVYRRKDPLLVYLRASVGCNN